MCNPSALDHLGALQFDRLGAQVVEEPDAVPEQDGHKVNMYLLKKSRPDALLRDARCAHCNVLLARCLLRLLYGAFDAFRDERERRSFVDPVLRDVVPSRLLKKAMLLPLGE
jgi:hypothetical protein